MSRIGTAWRSVSQRCRRTATGVLIALAGATSLQAQAAGYQDYYILGAEQHVWTFMERVRQTENATAFPAPARMNSVVSLSATVDGQVVYYDQWEDGFDANVLTAPGATTLVFGDQNTANGQACDWTEDPRVFPCTGVASHDDALFTGTFLTLASDQGITGCPAAGAIDPAGAAVPNWRCSVPVNPRSAANVRFDGGDRVFTTGSSLSIAHVQDPGTPLIGGGTELLARALVAPAVSYSVPVGENLFPGANNAFLSTKFVTLNLVAFDDNTQVTVTSPGVGSVSFTLNRGQHWSSCSTFVDDGIAGGVGGVPGTCTAGAIDGTSSAALMLRINSGTKVSTTGPLNALIFTGGPAEYATRHYALLPDLLHSTDYVITAPGDDPLIQGSRALNLYIFNPDPINSATINTLDSVGAATVVIPPNSVADYRNAVGRDVPNNSTVRLTSTNGRNFWGLSAYGNTDNISDWGHSWLATRFLTLDNTVAYSPGTQPYAVTSITRAGTTATVTTGSPHGLANGTSVTITGATQPQYNGTFVIAGVTANTFTYTVAGAPVTPATGTITVHAGPCDAGASGTGTGCNSFNRDPVFVAGTQNNTQIRVDLDNDGQWDFVDTNGDNCPDDGDAAFTDVLCQAAPVVAGCAPALTANRCVYRVGSPGAAGNDVLRIFDYTDLNNAGTRVLATRPVALSWGQDVDQGQGSDPSPDTGYSVYPLNDLFIDPVLSLEKTPNVQYVPLAGGNVVYTLVVRSHSWGPLSNLRVTDLLPPGVPGSAYVAGSTLITYPNLTQGTNNPTVTTVGSRDQLEWTLSPNTLQTNQSLTVRYTVNIPASGVTRALTNNAATVANLGGSVFRARASATIAQTAVTLVKSQSHDGQPEVGDVITYSLVVTNTGGTPETNVTVSDAIPADTTYVAGSVNSPAPFAGTFSAGQNAVVWTTATLAAGASRTLTFQVRINPGVARGTAIDNTGRYESDQATSSFLSNTVRAVVVGPQLTIAKTGGPSPLHPNEIVTFEVTADNVGSADATNLRIRDLFPTNATYILGTMSMSLNGAPFVGLTDSIDADEGTLFTDRVELLLATLGSGEDVRFRFQARVNPGTGGLSVANQANVSSEETGSRDTNLVQIPILATATATLTGRVFLDTNGDGDQDAGELGIANINVFVVDSLGGTQTAVTDNAGNYSISVPPGQTDLDVDEADPDFPAGLSLSPAPSVDPKINVNAVANATTATTAVGYRYTSSSLAITKTSDPVNHEVIQGDVITYTVTVTNNSAITRDAIGLSLTDTLPAGVTYVPGTSFIRPLTGPNTFRITEYRITAGFTGTTFNLTLNNNLMPDYFAIVQGSDGNGTNDIQPRTNYVAVTADPIAGTTLPASGATNRLVLGRSSTSGGTDWEGVVTVVECLSDCDRSGFRLRDALTVDHTTVAVGAATSAAAWNDINQVMLVGGANGPGCTTASATVLQHRVCHSRFVPSGTATIDWTRDASAAVTAATSTVMALEWGSDWTVQRRRIQGTNGGNGTDATTEYNVAAINPVTRVNTWVWGTGFTNQDGVGEAGEGVVVTLGDGVNLNMTENRLSVSTENAGTAIDFEVYALTNANLRTSHAFKVDGAGAAVAVAVTAATDNTARMALSYNGHNGTNTVYPSPLMAARYTANNQVTITRKRDGGAFPAWVQGIDFSRINQATAGGAPPTLIPVNTTALAPGESIVATFQATVDKPLAAGISLLTNMATVNSTSPGPTITRSASATDTVVRPVVVVEYNNAGFTTSPSTLVYHHVVVNTGDRPDSFMITPSSELGWVVELLDPNTGAVIATDADANGAWDGGPVNTGTLAINGSTEYAFRVTVPSGVTVGTEQTIRLFATSDRDPSVKDDATNETTILAVPGSGTVQLLPDNSGVIVAGGSTVYTHRVVNTTGLTDTFDLQANSSQGWPATIYYDNDGNGVYTPGVDIAVANTRQLANGESQVFFVVVQAPAGTATGTVDVTHLTARSRNNTNLFDGATDTTTVDPPSRHDLSGGGTREALPGDLTVFPGTIVNISTVATRFNFEVTPSSMNGLDSINHATRLVIDTNGDGTPDLQIAEDTDGDGDWDTIAGGYNLDADGRPDVLVAPNATLAYELRRPIAAAQPSVREFVTFSAESVTAGDSDSVTATVLLAALSRVTIRGLRVDPAGTVEFATGMQRGTLAFHLYEVADRRQFRARVRLTDEPIASPVRDSMTPILYRAQTRPLTQPFILIEELEASGSRRWSGPFSISDRRLRESFERIEARLASAGDAPSFGTTRTLSAKGMRRLAAQERRNEQRAERRRARRSANRDGVVLEISRGGVVQITWAELQAAGLTGAWGGLHLTNFGRAVPFTRTTVAGAPAVVFQAEALSTDYTGRNVYVFTTGRPAPAPKAELTRSGAPTPAATMRVEKSYVYLANAPRDADPWQWDALFADFGPWPYPWWGAELGQFDLPNLAPGATGDVAVRVRVLGYTAHHHQVDARINGTPIGSVSFAGAGSAVLTGRIRAELLRPTGNDLSLDYTPTSDDPNLPTWSAMLYLDNVDIDAPSVPSTQPGVVDTLSDFDSQLPSLKGVQYLIVTHPLFRAQADRLAALKQAEGLSAVVVDTDNVYDAFTGGIVEANAIRALVREAAAASHKLKYVLLMGDGTFDARDYTGFGAIDFVPSLMAHDGEFGRVPSENLYADVNDDGSPELAIGRLPVQTPEQADALVDKIASQATVLAASAGRHLFAVDNGSDVDSPFDREAERMAAALPPASVGTWAEVADGVDSARVALFGAWQNGVVAAHYFGHGGVEQWADEFLLASEDVGTLAAAKPAVVFSWACETQWFMNLWGPSLNEALVLSPTGGALASFGPAGITAPFAQRGLYEALYPKLGTGTLTLGEAIQQAKAAALAKDKRIRPVVDGWNLLGDPALRLPSPSANR